MADKFEIKNVTDEKTWEGFVTNCSESNFLQSYPHGKTNEALKKKVFYLGIYEKKKLVGVCLTIIEAAKRGKYITVPGGPLIDWDNKKAVKVILNYLKKLGQDENCAFIRIRPQVEDSKSMREVFRSLGLKQSPMHLTAEHTLQLDLTGNLEEILANMRKTTRYEIKQAEKKGIQVLKIITDDVIKEFYEVQLQTAKRNHFIPFSKELISSEFKEFVNRGQAIMYKSIYQKKPLAYALVIHYPTESSYHFGASTDEGRRLPGAYALQWEAIKDAKAKGIKRYNFWGIVGEEEKEHRFYGVSVFKRGFGGTEIKYVAAHDMVLNPLAYLPVFIFEKARKKVRRL